MTVVTQKTSGRLPRWHSAITPIFLLLWLFLLEGAQGAEGGPADAKKDQPPAAAGSGGGTESSGARPADRPAFPMAFDREHTYVWLRDQTKVGETRMRLRQVEAPTGSPEKALYRSTSRYRFESEGTSWSGEHVTDFSTAWRPLRYRWEHRYRGLKNMRSSQDQKGEVQQGRLYITAGHNKDERDQVRTDMEVPAGSYLLVNQAMDQWAILAADLLKTPQDHAAKALYPDFLRVYELRFTFLKNEEIQIGTRKVQCRLYSFRSTEGLYEGKVWMDPAGRMAQYQQGNLRIVLEE